MTRIAELFAVSIGFMAAGAVLADSMTLMVITIAFAVADVAVLFALRHARRTAR